MCLRCYHSSRPQVLSIWLGSVWVQMKNKLHRPPDDSSQSHWSSTRCPPPPDSSSLPGPWDRKVETYEDRWRQGETGETEETYLWMQFLLSRYAIPAAASTEKRTSCFVFNSSFFFLRKDRKSPPDRHSTGPIKHTHTHTHLFKCHQQYQGGEAPPTRNKLHDDVDRLSLRTNTNQLHNVWMVVLLQDPAANHRQAESDTSQSKRGQKILLLWW